MTSLSVLTACGGGAERLTVNFPERDCEKQPPHKAQFFVVDEGGEVVTFGRVSPSSGCNSHIETELFETAETHTVRISDYGSRTWTHQELAEADFTVDWFPEQ